MADAWTHITMFDKPYPAEKQAEGLAVCWAVASGACDKCRHLPMCESCRTFVPPADSACMVKKRELLAAQAGKEDEDGQKRTV